MLDSIHPSGYSSPRNRLFAVTIISNKHIKDLYNIIVIYVEIFYKVYFRNYLTLYHSYFDFQEAKPLEICACEILVVVKNRGGVSKLVSQCHVD